MDARIKEIKKKFSYIVVEGVIGAGKTTIASYLADLLGTVLILEKFEKNPFLEKFYKNPKKYALPVQTFFLNERFKQQLLLKKRIIDGEQIVSDYAFFKNQIFASVNLKKFDYFMFKMDEQRKKKKLLPPDLIIYLTATEKTLLKHIRKRGREYEKNISLDYLMSLNRAYHSLIQRLQPEKGKHAQVVLQVNMNIFDFENDKNLIYSLLERISGLNSGIHNFE